MIYVYCPLCGGELNLLGQLGQLLHYRCRACGGVYSDVVEEEVGS